MTIPHKMTLDDLWSAQNMGEIALSPDGRRVAFVMTGSDKEHDEAFSSLYLLLLDEYGMALASPRQLTHGLKKDGHPVWAADSRRLLFTSNREQGNQLWLIDSDGGEACQLTHMLYGVDEAAWSPDGQMIAFTAPTLAAVDDDLLVGRKILDESTKKDLAEQERLRLRTITRVHYRLDGAGLFERPTHVFVMPVPLDGTAWDGAAQIRRLTSGEDFYHMPLWTPDSREIGVLQVVSERDASFVADLWAINVESATARCLTEGTIEAEAYAWAPDGQSVVVVGARDMNVHGPDVARLFLVTRRGNVGDHPLCISPDFEYDASIRAGCAFGQPGPYRPQWSNDGQQIFFLASVSGSVHIYQLDVLWRTITQLSSPTSLTYSIALFPDGEHLLAAQEFSDHPWELYRLSATTAADQPERLTQLYDQWISDRRWGALERIVYTGALNDEVEGWLLHPVGAQDGVRYPLIVRIHGGPNSAYSLGTALDPINHYFAAQGYAVFYCNPHGSTCYGEAFMKKGVGDWGGADFEDIMRGVDVCIERGSADPERLAVMGTSYGGYMSMYIVGHTDRFKAAAPMAGISDLTSFVGTSDIGFWLIPQSQGYPWDVERAAYYRDRSPLSSVTNVTTPTLLLHGDADLRCPIGQSEQFYTALKLLAKVPTALIRIPTAWHINAETPAQYWFAYEKTLEWFNSHIEPQPVHGDVEAVVS
jgi:dipeptidyl aminopeptidase/acylaminoacyl peptidase